jgi:hypothetical protein
MSVNTESGSKKFNIKDYLELIETLAKVEYKKLSSGYLMEYSELVNIGTQVVHKLCANAKEDAYNKSYISTAIKWAIRNEVRRRYKWYVLKNKRNNILQVGDENEAIAVREAVYKTILSIDEMAEGDSPTQIKDFKRNPEEKIVFHELSESIKKLLKNFLKENENSLSVNFIMIKNSEKFRMSLIFLLLEFQE